MVTHNIEEAVEMCDRILVLGAQPGRIVAETALPMRQPRNRLDPVFHEIVDQIYTILTSRMTEAIGPLSRMQGGLGQRLPVATINRLLGFVETLAAPPYDGHAELAQIAAPLALEIDDL